MAQRVQMKRSSVQGRRPANQYLEPGELALNTNQNDPGLFFETNTGDIAKAGPAYIGPLPPETEVGYGPGEQWLDSGNGTLNLYVPALDKWVPVQSPLFGGAETTIFVGSEFPEATDDLSNDGIARPFATINRAMIEIARRSILAGRDDKVFNARFTVMLLPGQNVVCNDQGVNIGKFEELISGFSQDQSITQDLLRLFNPETGGLIVPRGTSIIALDLRKTSLHPTYYPFWSRSLYEQDPGLIESRTAILRWTGNAYFTSFTFKDKVDSVSVSGIDAAKGEDPAILTSLRPHGFRTLVVSDSSPGDIAAADRVTLSYPTGVSQIYDNEPTIPSGDYYVEPLTTYTFRLRDINTGDVILRNQLPEVGVPGSSPQNFLTLTYSLTSHHRLSSLDFATTSDLNEFYSKVQRAYSKLDFVGTVNNAEVAQGEVDIVAPLPTVPDPTVDTVSNGSPYIFNCSVRSEYGLCGAVIDGEKVNGFKSALFCNFTVVSIQNDPDVYEVYNAVDGDWVSLKSAYAASKGISLADVKATDAIDYLLSTAKVNDVRFFYRSSKDVGGSKSSGLPYELSDTRHYAVLAENRSYGQIVASFAIGVSINYWARNGSSMSVTNANSNFGGIALRAEGFAGIGTSGGAEDPDKGFTIQGIRRPAAITKQMVLDSNNIKRIFVNVRIVSVTTTAITFDANLDESIILPYSFRRGSYVWVEDYNTGTTYKAKLTTAGDPLEDDNTNVLIVDPDDNEIYTAVNGGVSLDHLSLLYLRRFIDPRPPIDRNYSLWVSNTSQTHRPPENGFVLRFAEKPGAGVSDLLKAGGQLDPGETGGWNHLFGVIDSRTKAEGDNPNGTEPLIVPTQGSQNYYVTVSALDGFKPWLSKGGNGFGDDEQFDYPRGAYSTYGNRPYYASFNDEAEESYKPEPSNQSSAWLRSKNYEYCQPVADTHIGSSSLSATLDPSKDSYTSASCYPRGIQYDRANPTFNNVYDNDDGTDTLGLISDGSYLATKSLYDPWWQPSKSAITRLLTLLGFTYDQVNSMLTPQLWTSRNLPVSSMPDVGTGGYANSTGTWPIEFNRPSTIRCGNHTWEWAGYYTYAKGLPKYQTSQLSMRERFDFMSNEVWGGVVYATGQTEKGEFIVAGKTVAGGTGTTLLRTEDVVQYFAPQDVTA